jgi:tetraacyldisaccharide 4'-kinase
MEAVPVPVLCVGNLAAGGAGKTPIAIDLARRLAPRGAHALGKGYGGRERGPLRVDPTRHDARAVGDEALLLAETAPTWIARDRRAGARAAVEAGARLIVMDDGFQYPGLNKDLSLLVFDGASGLGNGRVMPAGPLRETLAAGLARAQVAVIMGEDETNLAARIGARLPVLRARLAPHASAHRFAGRRVFAIAGIARPRKFRATLAELGANVVGARDFPDHHIFTEDEIMEACEAASALSAVPVTTAKDHVRLPEAARAMIEVVRVDVLWADEAALGAVLAELRAPLLR